MTDRILEREPPPLDLLATLARRAGFENPLVEHSERSVRVILWGHPGRRQVAAHCAVRNGMTEEEAIRSALAKALELAADPGARA